MAQLTSIEAKNGCISLFRNKSEALEILEGLNAENPHESAMWSVQETTIRSGGVRAKVWTLTMNWDRRPRDGSFDTLMQEDL